MGGLDAETLLILLIGHGPGGIPPSGRRPFAGAERDKLKAAVQRGLGAALEMSGTRELPKRIDELLAHGERLAAEKEPHCTQDPPGMIDALDLDNGRRQAPLRP
ncbi:hypothetical protein ACTMTI_22300 [Nonomuraea sp. H19]|uniref:hypothetical protein n=1 Tax=Nonomuraea sp. H19 TaxID=3452206 RepID=UPI003F897DFE